MTNFNYLFIFIFILFNLLLIINYKRFQNLMYKKLSQEDFKKDLNAYLSYIDKYYVKNIYFTVASVVIYFSLNIGTFIYLRMQILDRISDQSFIPPNTALIENMQMNYLNIAVIVMNLAIVLIALITFKILLDTLFYTEVLKLHLYLKFSKYNYIYRYYLKYSFFFDEYRDIFGKAYLFFYNISNLRSRPLPEEIEYEAINAAYNGIYENNKIIRLAEICVSLAKFNVLFLKFFYLLKVLSRTFYEHFDSKYFIPYIPYMITFYLLIIDIINMKIYYTIYGSFVVYIISIIIKIIQFYDNLDGWYCTKIPPYFYNDEKEYKKQREFFTHNIEIFSNKLKNLEEIIRYVKEDKWIYSITNNFKAFVSPEGKTLNLRRKGQYRRFVIMFILAIILYSFFSKFNLIITYHNYNLTILIFIIMLLLLTITYIYSIKIYTYKKNEFDYSNDACNFSYNKSYLIKFWLIVFIQISIYIILYIMSKIYIGVDDIIWEGIGLEIRKLYTIEEKGIILNFYIDIYEQIIKENKEYFKQFIEAAEIKEYITKDTTINTIKILLKNIVEDFIEASRYLEEQKLIETLVEKEDEVLLVLKQIYEMLGLAIITGILIPKVLLLGPLKEYLIMYIKDVLENTTTLENIDDGFLEMIGQIMLKANNPLIILFKVIINNIGHKKELTVTLLNEVLKYILS